MSATGVGEAVILAILLMGAWWALYWFVRRKRAVQRAAAAPTLVRSREHEAMIHMMRAWLMDEHIIRVLLGQRHATVAGVQGTLEALEGFDFFTLRYVGANIVNNREVRIAVARYELKYGRTGMPRAGIMKLLYEWAQWADTPPRHLDADGNKKPMPDEEAAVVEA